MAFALSLVARRLAPKLGAMDGPDGFRKLQDRPVPRAGGVAVFLAFFASLVLGAFVCRWQELADCLRSLDFLSLLGGAAAVLFVGLWDDIRGLRARWKLLGLALVAAAMYGAGYRIGAVSNPFGPAINLGYWALPVTVFWFLGCMNAVNLIDGLDGLAGGVVVFAAGTIFLTSMLFGNTLAALLSVALAGSALGFLLLNFHPASIFLGDSGSYLLGFLIAALGLRGASKSHMVVALVIPVIALGLPVMDTSLAILRRWSKALPVSASDRQHIHHKLIELGLSERQAVLLLYGACVLLGGVALLMSAANNLQAAALLAVFGVITCLVVRVIGRHEIKLVKRRLLDRSRRAMQHSRCKTAAYAASTKMRQARGLPDMWDMFSEAAQAMELDYADVILSRPGASTGEPMRRYRWHRDGGQDRLEDDVLWTANLPLTSNGTRIGTLRIRKATNGYPLGPEIPETLELLSKALSFNIARLQQASMSREPP